MGYQCAKDTKRTLPAIVLSAVVNVVLNFLLVKPFGIAGVIATLIFSYMVLLIYRWIDSKRYFTLHLHRGILLPVLITLCMAAPFYLCHALWQDALSMAGALVLIVLCCPSDIKKGAFAKFCKKFGK